MAWKDCGVLDFGKERPLPVPSQMGSLRTTNLKSMEESITKRKMNVINESKATIDIHAVMDICYRQRSQLLGSKPHPPPGRQAIFH